MTMNLFGENEMNKNRLWIPQEKNIKYKHKRLNNHGHGHSMQHTYIILFWLHIYVYGLIIQNSIINFSCIWNESVRKQISNLLAFRTVWIDIDTFRIQIYFHRSDEKPQTHGYLFGLWTWHTDRLWGTHTHTHKHCTHKEHMDGDGTNGANEFDPIIFNL